VKAANLRGTGFVVRDWAEEQIERTTDGETKVRRARFAGLEGYLMAKSHAVRHRGEEKDCYDLVHVLLYNRVGGPEQAGTLLAQGRFADDVQASRSIFREIEARFVGTADFGPKRYTLGKRSASNPNQTKHNSRKDAVGAIAEFIAALELP
jgi:hypothetical protein